MDLRRVGIFLLTLCAATGAQAAAQQFDPSLYQEMRWRLIGPFRAGRTVPAAGIPDQPNVFYVGVNNGGVWKTTDAGRTWNPIFDGQDTGSIGAVALAPSNPNILYVGSGENLQRPDLSVGDGIYKSTDGGQHWQHLGLREGQQIAGILVDPRDPNRVYAAVLGHPYGPNAERGVFRSLDGGQSWEKVLYKDENTGAVALAFDPQNPQTIYAAMWAGRRAPWSIGESYKGPGSGLYKSVDGGTTWRELGGGLPTWAEKMGRIGLDVSRSDPNRIYALVDADKNGGLYRSDDAGQSWKLVNTDPRIWGRGSDFAEVRVDPRNRDVVYAANIATYRSDDAGASFTAIKGAPGGDDYHAIWINPEHPEVMLLAADQGATITVNGGGSWSSWYNQPTAQFYHVITDNQFPYWVYGGQQESGSVAIASRSDYGAITFRDWHPVGAEEYGYIAPDPLHPNVIYGGKASRYDTSTGQTQDVSPAALKGGRYRFNRTAPLIFAPADPRTLYLGSNVLLKTTDGGHSWQVASPDLTRPDPGVPATLGEFVNSDPAHGKHRGVIYAIGPSFKEANLIWVGTDDGLIQVTRDGGKTWQNVTPPELTPWSKVAQIEGSHFDTGTAYAAVNRLRLDDLRPYIYRTHDGGKSWQKITAGLPDQPINTVREDPERRGLLFAGSERTVYVSFDDGEHWQSLQLNLPSTSIRDLVVHRDDVVVGTHGRSFWILDDITPLRQLTREAAESRAQLFRPQTSYRMRRSDNTDTPLPPETPMGQNPPAGAIVDYYLKAAAREVTLEIDDSAGRPVRRYSSADKPAGVDPKTINAAPYWVLPPRTLSAEAGMHRWVWDQHYATPESVNRELPISAIPHETPLEPLGPRALPGEYTVKLTVDGTSYTQPLRLRMDPRVKTGAAELAQQFALERDLAQALDQSFREREQAQELGRQLLSLQQGAASQPVSLNQALKALAGKAAALESGPESFEASNGSLTSLYEMVDSADTAPTVAETEAFARLRQTLASQGTRWQETLSRDVPALNQQLRQARLPEIGVAP